MKIILFLICLFVSQLSFAQMDDFFDTRLTPKLAISGEKCKGGEMSGVSDSFCEKGQWLIFLDDINVCEDNVCTRAMPQPFIAKLKRVRADHNSTDTYYEIIPKDMVHSSRRKLLGRYWVLFNFYQNPKVIWRNGK